MRHVQYCHKHSKPELLRAEKRMRVCPPLPKFDIVGISQDHKTPGRLASVSERLKVGICCTNCKTHPSNEAMVLLEHVVMITVEVNDWN